MRKILNRVPPGTDYVDAGEIPNWIADTLAPIPDNLPVKVTGGVEKKIIVDGKTQICEVNSADMAICDAIWSEMPGLSDIGDKNYKLDIQAHIDAFNSSPKNPGWKLQPKFIFPRQAAKQSWQNARNDHFKLLAKAISTGAVRVLTASHIPTDKFEPGTITSFWDAKRYLETLLLELVRDDLPVQTEPPSLQPVQVKAGNGISTHKIKRRTHPLGALIDTAKEQAVDATDPKSVWPNLKKMALSEELPFTGEVDDKKGLAYTNAENKQAYFSLNALRQKMGRDAGNAQ